MARNCFYLFFVLVFMILGLKVFSSGNKPVSIDSVNYQRIEQKKIRKLISMQKKFGISTFDEIHPVCYTTIDSLNYRTFKKSLVIKQDMNVVWNNLIHQSPSDEFNGRIVTFGLLYSKKHHNLLYPNDLSSGIEEGQLLFFNLRMLKGIKNLAVALEVTRMDNDLKEVEYCYVDHGDTKGTQIFSLKPAPHGYTEITQVAKYKCKSRLRDRRLYSFFHERILNEFFSAIKNKCESWNEGVAAGM